MKFTTLEDVLWAAGFIANLTLLTILVSRKRVNQFPVFTGFIAYEVVETVTLFLIFRHASELVYFRTYWLLVVGDYVLQIALILEMARNVLRPTGKWIRHARVSFFYSSAAGVIVAAAIALAITAPGKSGLDLWSIRSSMFTSLLICEVFLAMITTANRLGLRWKNHVMALGQGLTVWAVVALLGDVALFLTKWKAGVILVDDVRGCAYVSAVVFWALSFARPERERKALSSDMLKYLVVLHESVQDDLTTLKAIDRSQS